jgi:hypothetical protein
MIVKGWAVHNQVICAEEAMHGCVAEAHTHSVVIHAVFAPVIVCMQGECRPSIMVPSLAAFHKLLETEFQLGRSSSNGSSS